VIDVASEVNAVQRQVGKRVLEAGQARAVTLTRVYDAPVQDLWDACTNPERIPRWFLPVSGELRLGGRYQLEGNAGGTVEHCDPPRGFTATWEYAETVSWIDVRLSPEPDGSTRSTRLELEHIALVADDDKWAEFGPGAVGLGWDLALLGLGWHLCKGGALDPEQARAWGASPEGRRFISVSSERWRDADIAAGADAAAAARAAERTAAFYTGAPAPGRS
jgi:uncharacterized protein YndB with AHSA1/START domain